MTFLADLKSRFVQIHLNTQEVGVLQLERSSLNCIRPHADVSRGEAVSYRRLQEIEARLQGVVVELFTLGRQADQEK